MEKWFVLFNKWIDYNYLRCEGFTKKELWKKFVEAIKIRYNIKTDKIQWSKLDYNQVGKDLCKYYTDEQGRIHDNCFIITPVKEFGTLTINKERKKYE